MHIPSKALEHTTELSMVGTTHQHKSTRNFSYYTHLASPFDVTSGGPGDQLEIDFNKAVNKMCLYLLYI